MKLNYKRTILVGFAFFLISAFWQAYDATIPVILTNKFGMSQSWSGVIMAIDNILAVFMLPLFGALSDKCMGKYGKRTPFITIGTIIAAIALVGLSFVDNTQLNNISDAAAIDDPVALEVIYDTQGEKELMTPEGKSFVLSDVFTKEEFMAITTKVTNPTILNSTEALAAIYDTVAEEQLFTDNGETLPLSDVILKEEFVDSLNEKIEAYSGESYNNSDYVNYVAPARQAYAAEKTSENPLPLILFVALLLVILISMATYRSPAVALMPDVTIKPLRSKANAIINLMGTAGGILVLVLGLVFSTSKVKNSLMSYNIFYVVVAGIMLTALAIFLLTVREKKWAAQMQEDSIRLGLEEKKEEVSTEKRNLTAGEKKSLILILCSIALWYFGYNAVTSKYSVYASNVLQKDYNTTLLIAQAAAIISYLPSGIVASKIGRRKTILTGIVMLTTAFATASFMRSSSPTWLMNMMFALAGVAWATINVNSFPMVVEMCSGSDIGKYTGYYYTASMAAQIATPMLSGFLMDIPSLGMTVLFPYAAIFVALAFVTMFLVKHGDAKAEVKKGLEALAGDD